MTTVNRRELAEIIGKTEATVRTWGQEGLPIVKKSKGRIGSEYDTAAVIEWMIERQVNKVATGSQDSQSYRYDAERARLTHHQANNAAIQEQVAAGKLLDASEVEQDWVDRAMAMRAKLLALPGKLATVAVAATDLRQIEDAARDEVFAALEELSRGMENFEQSRSETSAGSQATA